MVYEDIISEVRSRPNAKGKDYFFRSAHFPDVDSAADGLNVAADVASLFTDTLVREGRVLDKREARSLLAVVDEHIREIFEDKSPPEFRYSQDFPALYAAKNLETCIEERKSLILRRIAKGYAMENQSVYYNISFCEHGPRCDLTGLCLSNPELVGENWAICQRIGKLIMEETDYTGLEYISVRLVDGVNACIFSADGISERRVISSYIYELDPTRSVVSSAVLYSTY